MASLLGSITDFFTNKGINDANVAANQANIAAISANQDKALAASGGSSDFKTVTQDPSGGFNSTQPGGASAATARGDLAFGDIGRAGNVNDITSNFNFKLPTLASAENVIAEGDQFRDTTRDLGLNKIAATGARRNRDENPLLDALTNREAGQFALENQFNNTQEALSLFDSSASNDIANAINLGNLNAPRAPAPAFDAGLPGTAAGQIVAQTPPAASIANLSPRTLGAASGSNLLAQLQAEEAKRVDNERMRSLIELFGQQGAFS